MGILDQFRLDGKLALVTGSAGGLGAAIAIALAEAGAAACHGNRRSADETSQKIRSLGRISESFACDLGTTDGAHILLLSQLAGRAMLERKQGKITNVAPLLSFQGGIRVVAYAASKGGVTQLTKTPLATECVGPNPTDRGKNGRKRSLLVDGLGIPLSLVASGANVQDAKLLSATLDQVVMESPSCVELQNLCADAGYKGAPAWNAVVSRNYQPHIQQRSEEAYLKRSEPGYKARCWVVERTHSWLN